MFGLESFFFSGLGSIFFSCSLCSTFPFLNVGVQNTTCWTKKMNGAYDNDYMPLSAWYQVRDVKKPFSLSHSFIPIRSCRRIVSLCDNQLYVVSFFLYLWILLDFRKIILSTFLRAYIYQVLRISNTLILFLIYYLSSPLGCRA